MLFQETTCSLLDQLNNYLFILLKSSIFQQVQNMGTSKNWILINFIEKPFFNQFMSGFAEVMSVLLRIMNFVFEYIDIQSQD